MVTVDKVTGYERWLLGRALLYHVIIEIDYFSLYLTLQQEKEIISHI